MNSNNSPVDEFLDRLEHPLKPVILEIRRTILASDNRLTEQIKWNAPSFCLDGEDRITMKLYPPKSIQIIFHRGAKAKEISGEKLITDDAGILKWAANDRAVATFTDIEEVRQQAANLHQITGRWLAAA